MSRQITYSVTYGNNKKETIAGLYNPVNAELSVSHFNSVQRDDFMRKILLFEKHNTKKIKKKEYHLNASTGSTSDVWLDETVPTVSPEFPVFRQIFDKAFKTVNNYTGKDNQALLLQGIKAALLRLEDYTGTDCECDNTHEDNRTVCCLCELRLVEKLQKPSYWR